MEEKEFNELNAKKAVRNLKVCAVTLCGCIGTISLCKIATTNPIAAIDFVCGTMGGIGMGFMLKSIVDDNQKIKELKRKK